MIQEISDYREYVGKNHRDRYDLTSAQQFIILLDHGLREYHKLLDIGCGSLRGGRLFIPYLLEGNYYGIEPNDWILNEGIQKETGEDLIKIRKVTFLKDDKFNLTSLGTQFDYILAHSIFTHATQDQMHKCLSEMSKVMKKDGLFIGTFLEGKNYEGYEWVYPETVTYEEKFIIDISKKYGFDYEKLKYIHVNGKQTWFKLKF